MTKIKTYAYKLYKAKRNKKLFAQIVAAGLTYNHCIALCKRYYSLFGKTLSKQKLQKHLTKLKQITKSKQNIETENINLRQHKRFLKIKERYGRLFGKKVEVKNEDNTVSKKIIKKNLPLKKFLGHIQAKKTHRFIYKIKEHYKKLFKQSLPDNKAQNILKHIEKKRNFRKQFVDYSKKYDYLLKFGSQAVQNITDRIEFGYQKFFRGENKRPPKFRKLSKAKSFTLKQAGWQFDEENCIIVINGQKYHYYNHKRNAKKHRKIEGKIKTVTIKKDSVGNIFIYFACELPDENEVIPRLGKSIGFDFGFKDYMLVAPSPENNIAVPMFFEQNHCKMRKIQKRIAKKLLANTKELVKKGKGMAPVYKRPLYQCRNLQKDFLDQARLHRKIANMRKDFHWKLARVLCEKFAFIGFETLNMKWMQTQHGKKVGDYGFADFLTILEYTASKFGTTIRKADKWFPSSQICSTCGYRNQQTKKLRVREWICPECNTHHDRDMNAAKNILSETLLRFNGFVAAE